MPMFRSMAPTEIIFRFLESSVLPIKSPATNVENAVNNNSACEITLTEDITLSASTNSDNEITIPEGKDVTLNLNNHTIRRNCSNNTTTSYRFFDVYGDFTLVDNSTAGNGKITGAYASRNNYAGIRVRSTGVFTMKSGTISNNAANRSNGGAVYIDGGKFIMEGDFIFKR